jgi:hypothetical protein
MDGTDVLHVNRMGNIKSKENVYCVRSRFSTEDSCRLQVPSALHK